MSDLCPVFDKTIASLAIYDKPTNASWAISDNIPTHYGRAQKEKNEAFWPIADKTAKS